MSTSTVDHHQYGPLSYFAALLGFLSALPWERIIYVLLAVGTFTINWYYKHRAEQRAIKKDSEKKHDG